MFQIKFIVWDGEPRSSWLTRNGYSFSLFAIPPDLKRSLKMREGRRNSFPSQIPWGVRTFESQIDFSLFHRNWRYEMVCLFLFSWLLLDRSSQLLPCSSSILYSPLLYQTWPLSSSLLSTRSVPISNSCLVCSLQALTPSFLSSAKGSLPLTFQVRRLQHWLIRVRWVSECVGTHSQSLFRTLGTMGTIGYLTWSDQKILFRAPVADSMLSFVLASFPTPSISRSFL